jgi:hypothetical protein
LCQCGVVEHPAKRVQNRGWWISCKRHRMQTTVIRVGVSVSVSPANAPELFPRGEADPCDEEQQGMICPTLSANCLRNAGNLNSRRFRREGWEHKRRTVLRDGW